MASLSFSSTLRCKASLQTLSAGKQSLIGDRDSMHIKLTQTSFQAVCMAMHDFCTAINLRIDCHKVRDTCLARGHTKSQRLASHRMCKANLTLTLTFPTSKAVDLHACSFVLSLLPFKTACTCTIQTQLSAPCTIRMYTQCLILSTVLSYPQSC